MATLNRVIFLTLLTTALACSGKVATGSGDLPGDGPCLVNCPQGAQSFTARIIRPNGNVSILFGTTIDFRADFMDGVNPVGPPTVGWNAGNLPLGDTNPLLDQSLRRGAHAVTVTGTLADSRTATDSVQVTVGDIAVEIINPNTGDVRTQEANVNFQGAASVSNPTAPPATITLTSGTVAGQRQATFAWNSSINGAFGPTVVTTSENFVYNALTVGTHTITLTVTDNLASGSGASGTASVTLSIVPPNTAPTVSIAPACPHDVTIGTSLSLTGTITDPGPADQNLVGTWKESITGATQSGNAYTFTNNDVGKHQVTFSATDSAGDTGDVACDVFVTTSGNRADLFPNSTAINTDVIGPDPTPDIRWIGAPDGNTWIGSNDGLTIFNGTVPPPTYDGSAGQLNVGGGNPQVNGAVVAGDAFVATDQGLAQCDLAAGVLSNCVQLDAGDFAAVSARGDVATSGMVAGAANGGLYLASYAAGVLTTQQTFTQPDVPNDRVRDVLFVGSTLYIATDDGLCVAEDPNGALPGTVDLCTPTPSRPTGTIDAGNSALPDNQVRALAWDTANGVLWIGTANGLVRYDPSNGAMTIYNRDTGLVDDRINDVLVDSEDIVWVATDNGVSRLDPTTGASTNFSPQDFGLGGGTQFWAVFVAGNGVKWFGTDNGVVRYMGV